jgi:hypothetical protein
MQSIQQLDIDIDKLSTKEIMSRLIFLGEELDFQKHNKPFFLEKLEKALLNPKKIELLQDYEKMIKKEHNDSIISKKRQRDSSSIEAQTNIQSSNLLNKSLSAENVPIKQSSANYNIQTVRLNNQSNEIILNELPLHEEELNEVSCISNKRVLDNVNSHNQKIVNEYNNAITISPLGFKISEFQLRTISPISRSYTDSSLPVSPNYLTNIGSIPKQSDFPRAKDSIKSLPSVRTQRLNIFDNIKIATNEAKPVVSTLNIKQMRKLGAIIVFSSIAILLLVEKRKEISSIYFDIDNNLVIGIMIGIAAIVIIAVLVKKMNEGQKIKLRLCANNLILKAEKTLKEMRRDGTLNYAIDGDEFIENFCKENDIKDSDLRIYMNDIFENSIVCENVFYEDGIIKKMWALK